MVFRSRRHHVAEQEWIRSSYTPGNLTRAPGLFQEQGLGNLTGAFFAFWAPVFTGFHRFSPVWARPVPSLPNVSIRVDGRLTAQSWEQSTGMWYRSSNRWWAPRAALFQDNSRARPCFSWTASVLASTIATKWARSRGALPLTSVMISVAKAS